MTMRERTAIKKIILHCSDSEFGDATLIDHWHKEKGWTGIGYHFVITNGVRAGGGRYNHAADGWVQPGRDLAIVGAHCKGQNTNSVGVCLIGKHHFTARQLYEGLPNLLEQLFLELDLSPEHVFGHCEFDPGKTCPNFNVEMLRKLLEKGDA